MTDLQAAIQFISFIQAPVSNEGPISGGAVLRSKLVDGMCQVQIPVALVDLAIRGFLRNSLKYGLVFLSKTPTEGTPPTGPSLTSGQLALFL